ncbi:hypothetical protein Tco_0675728 [Tanacetum coccineum]
MSIVRRSSSKSYPKKLGDPGKFLIPCDFPGNGLIASPLPILGTSINLMSIIRVEKAFLFLKLHSYCGMTLDLRNGHHPTDRMTTQPEVDHSYHDSKGDILLLEAFLNDDPSLTPPTQGMYLPQIRKELKICEAKNKKSSIDEPPEVELKDFTTVIFEISFWRVTTSCPS